MHASRQTAFSGVNTTNLLFKYYVNTRIMYEIITSFYFMLYNSSNFFRVQTLLLFTHELSSAVNSTLEDAATRSR